MKKKLHFMRKIVLALLCFLGLFFFLSSSFHHRFNGFRIDCHSVGACGVTRFPLGCFACIPSRSLVFRSCGNLPFDSCFCFRLSCCPECHSMVSMVLGQGFFGARINACKNSCTRPIQIEKNHVDFFRIVFNFHRSGCFFSVFMGKEQRLFFGKHP